MNLKAAIISLFLALFFTAEVNAFAVSPIGFKSTIEPGGKQNFNITVNNNESETHRYHVVINTILSMEDGRRRYESGVDEAESWAQIEPASFSLRPGQEKKVSITISVPERATPGARQLAFLVASENLESSEIGLTAHSAIPVNLVVSGAVIERLTFRKFAFQKMFTTDNVWPYFVDIYNEGTMDVQTSGLMKITSMFGKEVASEQVVLGNSILPQSQRRLNKEVVAPAIWPGLYTAKLFVQFGKTNTLIAAETKIWYVPLWFSGLLLVLFITLTVWLWSRNRTKKTI